MSITEHLFHPLVNALGWTLLHSLWQILLIALLWKLTLRIAKKASPNLKHNITLTALLMIPAAFCYTLYRQWEVFSNAKRIVSLEFEDSAWLAYGGETSFFMVQKSYPELLNWFDAYTPLIFLVYVAGLILFSLNGIAGYLKLFTLRYRYSRNIPAEWAEKVAGYIKKSGLSERIKLYITPKISVPCVVGFIKPVILLPVSFFTALSPEQIETIILHELSHIRRKDHLVNMLQNILETVFFYHPCTWWISNHLRRERENCVDSWVVKKTGKPMIYALALLKLEEEKAQNALQPSLAATSNKNHLLTRIKNIMHMKTSKFNPGQKIATILVIIAAAASVAWINPAMNINLFASAETGIDKHEATIHTAEDTISAKVIEESRSLKEKEPRNIYLQDGSSITWQELSEKDRKEIRKALEEARLAIQEVNKEVFEKLNSDEFRAEMQQAGADINKAMEMVNRELFAKINSEEFKSEMQLAREEIRRAMEEEVRPAIKEAHQEIASEFKSEEFKKEMQKIKEEINKALEELDEDERQQIREEINRAMKELEEVDWDQINKEIQEAMKEVSKAMSEVGKAMNEVGKALEEIEFDKLFEEINKAVMELDKEIKEAE